MTTYLCVVIIHLYQTYGTPSLQSQYWRRVASDNLAQYLIPLGLFRSSHLQLLVMMMVRPRALSSRDLSQRGPDDSPHPHRARGDDEPPARQVSLVLALECQTHHGDGHPDAGARGAGTELGRANVRVGGW